MPEISPDEREAAESVFGPGMGLATRFVEHLSTSGIERGLLGPREVPRLWGRHVLNCAVVARLIPQGKRVTDVGSGAGLPGLTFAIARPDLALTLIEPLERRVNWLEEVIEDLALTNVQVKRGRAEQFVGRVETDVVTARAVSALTNLAALTIPLLSNGGEVLAIKGRSAPVEIDKAAKAIERLGGRSAEVISVGDDVLDEPTTVVRILVRLAEQTLV